MTKKTKYKMISNISGKSFDCQTCGKKAQLYIISQDKSVRNTCYSCSRLLE
jgi:hypothetical protein